jgi:hypothetical protein
MKTELEISDDILQKLNAYDFDQPSRIMRGYCYARWEQINDGGVIMRLLIDVGLVWRWGSRGEFFLTRLGLELYRQRPIKVELVKGIFHEQP